MSISKTIRRLLKELEAQAAIAEDLRAVAKTEGGRLTDFGADLLAVARKHGVKQALMARLLAISAGAVSQHYNK